MTADVYHLDRFLEAQNPVYDRVRAELRAGAKTSHWMWFIFPQLKGLGRSVTADYFGIASLAEARAYGQHPVLGARLKECSELVVAIEGRTAHQVFGSPDDLKLCSSNVVRASRAAGTRLRPRAGQVLWRATRPEHACAPVSPGRS